KGFFTVQPLDFSASPSLPYHVVNSQAKREFSEPLQPERQIEVDKFRLSVSGLFFQFGFNRPTVFRLGQDRDIMKTRRLQRPLPADFRLRTFMGLTGKGREKNSLPAQHCCNYGFRLGTWQAWNHPGSDLIRPLSTNAGTRRTLSPAE